MTTVSAASPLSGNWVVVNDQRYTSIAEALAAPRAEPGLRLELVGAFREPLDIADNKSITLCSHDRNRPALFFVTEPWNLRTPIVVLSDLVIVGDDSADSTLFKSRMAFVNDPELSAVLQKGLISASLIIVNTMITKFRSPLAIFACHYTYKPLDFVIFGSVIQVGGMAVDSMIDLHPMRVSISESVIIGGTIFVDQNVQYHDGSTTVVLKDNIMEWGGHSAVKLVAALGWNQKITMTPLNRERAYHAKFREVSESLQTSAERMRQINLVFESTAASVKRLALMHGRFQEVLLSPEYLKLGAVRVSSEDLSAAMLAAYPVSKMYNAHRTSAFE